MSNAAVGSALHQMSPPQTNAPIPSAQSAPPPGLPLMQSMSHQMPPPSLEGLVAVALL